MEESEFLAAKEKYEHYYTLMNMFLCQFDTPDSLLNARHTPCAMVTLVDKIIELVKAYQKKHCPNGGLDSNSILFILDQNLEEEYLEWKDNIQVWGTVCLYTSINEVECALFEDAIEDCFRYVCDNAMGKEASGFLAKFYHFKSIVYLICNHQRVKLMHDIVASFKENAHALNVRNVVQFPLSEVDKKYNSAFSTEMGDMNKWVNDSLQAQPIALDAPAPFAAVQEAQEETEARQIPEELDTPEAHRLWDICIEEGWVDENLKPKISNKKISVVANQMALCLSFNEKWKPFETLWGFKDLSTTLSTAKNYAKYYTKLEKEVTSKLKKLKNK